MADKATYERLQKDVEAVKNDISALTAQLSDTLDALTNTAQKRARRGYKQARSGVDAFVETRQLVVSRGVELANARMRRRL